jgi:hypothetical protein
MTGIFHSHASDNGIEAARRRHDFNRQTPPRDDADEIAMLERSAVALTVTPVGKANAMLRIAFLKGLQS